MTAIGGLPADRAQPSAIRVPLLLLSTETRWLGAARAPRALARAGFAVSVLAPPGTLLTKSGPLDHVAYLPPKADARQWVAAFEAIVDIARPRLLVPCDDMAYRLLCTLYFAAPPGMPATRHAALAVLIRESLGDPANFLSSVDKVALPALVTALGVDCADFRIVTDAAAALDFGAAVGWPLVVKSSHSTGGTGVWICADGDAVQAAFAAARRRHEASAESATPLRLLVQANIEGPRVFYPLAAWRGRVLAGYASEALVTHPPPKGPATVVRAYRDDTIRAAVERIVRELGISGLLGFEFMIEQRTGRRCLLEINRRMVPGIHRGARLRCDGPAALRAMLLGQPSPTRSDLDHGETSLNVHFPQEWLRDPDSHWLHDHPVDVPWDEPELLAALLALRHGD